MAFNGGSTRLYATLPGSARFTFRVISLGKLFLLYNFELILRATEKDSHPRLSSMRWALVLRPSLS